VPPILIQTLRQARRAIIAIFGLTSIALGAVMILTPGPGWLVIFVGLSVLAVEFVWARRLLKRFKEKGAELGGLLFGGDQSRK
jgi:uncharacterized protein (TIGR02611 family)